MTVCHSATLAAWDPKGVATAALKTRERTSRCQRVEFVRHGTLEAVRRADCEAVRRADFGENRESLPTKDISLSYPIGTDIEAFDVQDLPSEVFVEYIAEVADGARLVVTRPGYEWTYDDFRVFYGGASALSERQVFEVVRSKNLQTDIRFELDGSEANAHFPSPDLTTDAASLTVDGDVLQITILDPATDLSGVAFSCLKND